MSIKILLADESLSIKKAFQVALSGFDVEIKPFPTGADILSAVPVFKPHIIFIDVLLSDMTGYDVCRSLRASQITPSIPIILMWSGFMDFDLQKAQSSGCTDRLEKPFDGQNLRDLITKYLPNLLRPLEQGTQDLKSKSIYQPTPKVSPETSVTQQVPLHLFRKRPKDFVQNKSIELELKNFGNFDELISANAREIPLPPSIEPEMAQSIEKWVRDEVRVITEKICLQMIPKITEKVVRESLDEIIEQIEKNF